MTTALQISKKAFTTAVVAMTVLWSVGAAALVSPLVAQGAVAVADLANGDLIMTDGAASGATVYVYNEGKKYPFPNQGIFASWYGNDFSNVMRISGTDMGSLAWGDNMLYRPGSRLIKVPDDPKVYAVLPGGVVAWVKDEATASKFYGASWASRVDDLLASLFVANYTNDPSKDLTASSSYPDGTLLRVDDGGEVAASAMSYYYIDGGKKRMVSADALAQFRTDFALDVSSADIEGISDGDAVGTGEFLNPVLVQEGATTPGATAPEAPAVPAGNLSFALSADSRTARVLDASILNSVLRVSVSGTGTIDSLTFSKKGTLANTNITGMRVKNSAGDVVGNVLSSINEDNTFTFNNLDWDVDGSDSIDLQIDLGASAGAADGSFSLTDVGSDASVSGSPVNGFFLDVKDGSSVVATVTFDLDGPVDNSSVEMNNELEVFNFTLRDTNSKERTTFEGIHLYNNGSVTEDDVKDYKLVDASGNVLQTVQQDGKWVMFDDINFECEKGCTKVFNVKATPVDGATRTIDLQLQNDYDLMVMGKTAEHYSLPTLDGTSNDTSFPAGDESGYTTMTLSSGSLTLDKASDSPTSNYAVQEDSVVLGKFTVKATGEDMEVRKVGFSVYETAASETDLAGSIFIKSGNSTLYSAAFASTMFSNSTTAATTTVTLSNFLSVPAGESRDITIIGNISSSADANDTYGANLDITQIKRMITGDLTDPSVSVVNTSARSVKAAALSIDNVTMAASGSYKIVAGTNAALVGKFTLNSSAGGEDVKLANLVTRLDTGANGAAVGDWTNLRLYMLEDDGTETLLTTSNNTDTGAATNTFTFSNPQVISKSDVSGVTYVLRANLSGAVGANELSTFNVHATTTNATGNGTGNAVTETVNNGYTSAASAGSTTLITATGGQLKISLDTLVSASENALVNVGTADYVLGAFTVKGEDEDQRVTALKATLAGTVSLNDVTNLRMYVNSSATPTVSTVQMATIDGGVGKVWTSSDKLFEVAAGETVKIKFVGNISGSGQAKLGNNVRINFDSASAITSTGKFTNNASTNTLLSNNGITHTIQPFSVTVSEAGSPYPASNIEANPSTGTLLAKFKLHNSGAVSITTTQFKILNNGSCTFSGTLEGSPQCNGANVYYSLKSSGENSESTSNLVSSHNTFDKSGESNSGVISWDSTSSTLLGESSANLAIAGGRYRTFGVYVSSTPDDFASGSSWQFSVATEGDMTFTVAESALGYDANIDGDQVDGITSLKARGKPSLPTLTDKTT